MRSIKLRLFISKILFVCSIPVSAILKTFLQLLVILLTALLEKLPSTYAEIDKVLRPKRRDTLYMNFFIEKASEANYIDGLCYAYNQKGTKYRNISMYAQAIGNHQKALDYSISANNLEFRIFSLNMLGVAYRRWDAIKTALDYNQEAITIGRKYTKPFYGHKAKYQCFFK